MRFDFPSNYRLRTTVDYRGVYRLGKRFHLANVLFVVYPNDLAYPRIGLSITKKHVRSAVKRNRVKRIAREKFRLTRAELPSVDVIIASKKNIATVSRQELWQQLAAGWRKVNAFFPDP